MTKAAFLIYPALALAVLPWGTIAQEQSAMENTLVTGTYSPRPELTSSSSILESEQIRALNKRNVVGLLKTLPGLLVEEQGGPGGLTAVSIRGAESNFTLVLLDGIPLNDPTNFRGGGYDFSNLSSEMVERIEVVRGPQSAIYGSDALAGVINIITRRAGQGHNQQVYYEWGEDDFYDLGFNATGTVGDFEYALDVAHRDDGEPVEGSTRETDNANLRLGWRVAPGHQLSAHYRYLDGDRSSYPEQSGGPEYAMSDALDKSDYRDEVMALGWQAELSSHWRSKLHASRFEHNEDYRSPGIFPYSAVPPNTSDTDFQRDQVQWVNTLQLSAAWQFNLGADYRDEDGKSRGYLEFGPDRVPTDFKLDRSTTGVFIDLSATPVEALLLQGSVRYDDPDDFDSETTWHLGASYAVGEGVTVSGNWGEAFKLPSFFALGHALVGNSDLQPEKATSWDMGIAWAAPGALHLGATYFYNDFKDLIDFDPDNFTNVNRSQVETSGVELQLGWAPLDSLSLLSQATYTDLDVKNDESKLTGRPDWTAGVVLQWQFASRWSSTLDYQWTGEQYATSLYTEASVTEELDDYHRLDWVLHWEPIAALQLQVSLDNVTDEDYQTSVGFPAPGRAVRLGVRLIHH